MVFDPDTAAGWYRVDDAQLARAAAQLAPVGSTWDGRLRRIKRIAEAIQRSSPECPTDVHDH